MITYRDFDGTWRVSGFEQFAFPTQCAAETAIDLAEAAAREAATRASHQENRFMRAAEQRQASNGR